MAATHDNDREQSSSHVPPAVDALAKHPIWVPAAGVLGFVLLGFAWLLLPVDEWLKQFSEWLTGFGVMGALAFAVFYAIGTLLLMPGTPLTVAAGVAYGWWALLLVWFGGVFSATVAFLIGRYYLRTYVEGLAHDRPALRAAKEAVSEEGWKVVSLIRLSPVIPFGVQNYFFGATDVSLTHYVVATAVMVLPAGFLNVYLGVIGRAAAEGRSPASWGLLVLGIVATLAVLILITRKARAKLREYGVR